MTPLEQQSLFLSLFATLGGFLAINLISIAIATFDSNYFIINCRIEPTNHLEIT